MLLHRPSAAPAAPSGANPLPGVPGVPGVSGASDAAVRDGGRPEGLMVARPRGLYLALLTWAFTVSSSVRILAYLPTVWAIHTSGDSSQHSLWTWLTWLGANATMAAWLYEENGQRPNRAMVVSTGNACMCLLTVVVIVVYRL